MRRTRAYASTPRRAAAQRWLTAALKTLFVCRLVSNGEDLLRSLQPEASFMVGNETVLIGGVTNNATNHAFKNASEPLTFPCGAGPPRSPGCPFPGQYMYKAHKTVPVSKRFDWVPGARHSEHAEWPPLGLGLQVTLEFQPLSPGSATPAMPVVTITYEMYQGLPAMSKKVGLEVASGCTTVSGLMVERLAFQETHLGRNTHFDTDWAWCVLSIYRYTCAQTAPLLSSNPMPSLARAGSKATASPSSPPTHATHSIRARPAGRAGSRAAPAELGCALTINPCWV